MRVLLILLPSVIGFAIFFVVFEIVLLLIRLEDRICRREWYRERKRAKYFSDSAWRLCRFCGFSDHPSDPPWFADRARLAWQGGMRYQRWNI